MTFSGRDEGQSSSTNSLLRVAQPTCLAACLAVAGGLSDSLPCLSIWPLRLELKIDHSFEGPHHHCQQDDVTMQLGRASPRLPFLCQESGQQWSVSWRAEESLTLEQLFLSVYYFNARSHCFDLFLLC